MRIILPDNITISLAFKISNSIHLPDYVAIQNAPINGLALGPGIPARLNIMCKSHSRVAGDERQTPENGSNALHTLGLTGQVRTQKIGDVGIELQVGRLRMTELTKRTWSTSPM